MTERQAVDQRGGQGHAATARQARGASRLTVMLFTVATFLVVLSLLARQLPAPGQQRSVPVHVLRKVYRTTIVETILGSDGPSGASVSQSVSSSGAGATPVSPTTHTS